MPRKKLEKQTKNSKRTKIEKSVNRQTVVPENPSTGRWGESYTSLLLGVVVVIVGVLFGVTLIKQHRNMQDTSSIATAPSVTATPSVTPTTELKEGENTYIVQSGDNLWHISEKFYKSGYNWVDIAKANNLSDPSTIHVGNSLVIPSVTPAEQTVTPTPTQVATQPNAISGNSYTVQKGDDLWSIAVRAYGDGYKWVDIAKANNLSAPGLIFSGNILTIPR